MNNKLSSEVLIQYTNVIKAFKNRYDVQNGTRLGYRKNQDPNGELLLKNKPHSIGEGLTTTGFCVSVSQAFINDNAFKHLLDYRNAKAKLISIDIKEEFFGECYNGSKNSWHTAILVSDGGVNFVIDMTCAQFGNRYVEKFIWSYDTWQKTFRSPLCKHKITDFNGNELRYNLLSDRKPGIIVDNYDQISLKKESIKQALYKEVFLTEQEIDFMTEFFYEKKDNMNIKLCNGVLNKFDIKYNDVVTGCLSKMDIKEFRNAHYYIMKFPDKNSMLSYINILANGEFFVNHYIMAYENMEDAKMQSGIYGEINSQDMKENTEHYLVFEFIKPITAIDTNGIHEGSILIPYGSQINVDIEKDIFNGVELLQPTILNTQKTNTVYIRI